MNNQEIAAEIARRFEVDLRDRSGVGNELEMCDDGIVDEMRAAWRSIALQVLEESGR